MGQAPKGGALRLAAQSLRCGVGAHRRPALVAARRLRHHAHEAAAVLGVSVGFLSQQSIICVRCLFDYRIIVAMKNSIRDTALPNDIEALKAVIVERDETISERNATIERLTRHAERLQEQLN